MTSARAAFRQPLLYFILLGAAVFFVDLRLRKAADVVRVTDAVQHEVESELRTTYGRAPTEAELADGVQNWIDTELLFREASALGLQENDATIRLQLANKLRHMVRQRTIADAPSIAELTAQLNSDPARYTQLDTFTVLHVFVSNAPGLGSHDARVAEVLSKLITGAQAEGLGDHFPRGPEFPNLTQLQLEQIFEAQLTEQLKPERLNQWQAVSSRRGTHLIRLQAFTSGRPDLKTLQPVLAADVEQRKKDAALQAFTAGLRKKHAIEFAATK